MNIFTKIAVNVIISACKQRAHAGRSRVKRHNWCFPRTIMYKLLNISRVDLTGHDEWREEIISHRKCDSKMQSTAFVMCGLQLLRAKNGRPAQAAGA